LALGFASDWAQRCQVAGPSVLAIPSSSPAPHREGGAAVWASAAETTVLAVASAKSSREIDILRLPDFSSQAEALLEFTYQRQSSVQRCRLQGRPCIGVRLSDGPAACDSALVGEGWGGGRRGAQSYSTPRPLPTRGPQGAGEECAAPLRLNLTPMGATLVVARFAHRVCRQQGDHKGR